MNYKVKTFIFCILGIFSFSLLALAENIGKEQALILAKQSKSVQAFYSIKEGALKDCIEAEVMRPCDSNWVTCIEDAWVVKFLVSEKCLNPKNEQLGVTLLIDSKTGNIISQYPELDYFKNPLFCQDSSECRSNGKKGQLLECKNFIYALLDNSSASQDVDCLCHDSQCAFSENYEKYEEIIVNH